MSTTRENIGPCIVPCEPRTTATTRAEPIEGAVEVEREDAEKRDAEPEEVQRRLISRTSQAHGCADEERDETHRRQRRVHAGATRRRREIDRERLLRSE